MIDQNNFFVGNSADINFEGAKKFINEHDNFLMATHAYTDGDDCGSMLALNFALKQMGKSTTLAAAGGVPPNLEFLPSQNEVLASLSKQLIAEKKIDAIILFGCSNKERTELPDLITLQLPTLNIDHHPDNKMFGNINLVDPQKSSVAELVYDFFKNLGTQIDANIAKCLLTGIFTDTGSFMHANTAPSTLKAAAELMKYGARTDKIFNFTYSNKNTETLRAWGKAMEKVRIDPNNKIAICVLTEQDLNEIGPVSDDAFDGFVDTLNTIPDTRFSLFVRQEGDYIKGSMRSEEHKNVDVAQIAKSVAGGGHKLAAGFKIKGKIEKAADGSWKIV
jgi:phosphoesterase RecJ-like protein